MSTQPSDTALSTPTTPESTGIDERRAGYDAFLARELPADVRAEVSALGARPALELIPETVQDEQARLVYLHGGAFVMGSPAGYGGFTAQFARRAAIRTVSLDYRLAPEHPFPAAVEDGLAAYRDLLDRGTPPEQDRAGRGLRRREPGSGHAALGPRRRSADARGGRSDVAGHRRRHDR